MIKKSNNYLKKQPADLIGNPQVGLKEAGMATVETALVMMVAVLIVCSMIAALFTVSKQDQACQISRESARAYTLGYDPQATAWQINPTATVSTSTSSNLITVETTLPALDLGDFNLGNLTCKITTVNEQVYWQ